LATDGTAPTFGLWYDLRLKPPLEDYAARLSGITHERELKSMRLFASEVAPWVGDGVEA
jgi:hypothetical protein